MYNVMNYGAVGDGVANDSPAFVAAFAAAMLTQGTVYVPRGSYRLASIVNVANGGADMNLRMVGDGPSSVIIPDCTGQIYCIGFTNFRGVEVANLRFNGAGRQSARCADSFVLQFYNTNGWVHDCRFENLLTLKSTTAQFEGVISNYGGASGGRLRMDRVRIAASCDVGTAQDHSYVCNLGTAWGFRGFEAYDCWFQETFTPTETAAHVIYFGELVIHGINDADFAGAGAYNSLIPVDYDQNADDGALVSPHRYVYDNDAIRLVNVRMCGQVKTEHLKFSPTNARYPWIFMDGVQFGQSDFNSSASIYIKQANHVEITRAWSGIGGAFHTCPGITLIDAGHVLISDTRLEGDDLYRPPNCGHTRITADAATKSLYLRNVFYKEIVADCPCTVEKNGVRGALYGTTAEEVAASLLVKLRNDGQIAPLGVVDGPARAIGVSLEATQKAYGYAIFNNAFDITEGDKFELNDGINPALLFTFTLNGTTYPTGRTVSVNNGMTSDERAQAFAAQVSLAHGTGFQITAAPLNDGSGRVYLLNDNVGYVGNALPTVWDGNTVAGKQSSVAGAIVVLGLGEGVTNIPVAFRGQIVPVRNDNLASLVSGDLVSPSTVSAGCVTKSDAAPVGVVRVGCAPGGLAQLLLH